MKSKYQEVAERYFELSNESDFDGIAKFLTDRTTYSSQNTGIYFGSDNIIAMQKPFHAKFKYLNWQIDQIQELKPGIIQMDYTFEAELPDGQKIESEGTETVVVSGGQILHIEIRNR